MYFFFQFIELIHVSIEGVSMGACAVQQLQTRAELQENAAFKFSFRPWYKEESVDIPVPIMTTTSEDELDNSLYACKTPLPAIA